MSATKIGTEQNVGINSENISFLTLSDGRIVVVWTERLFDQSGFFYASLKSKIITPDGIELVDEIIVSPDYFNSQLQGKATALLNGGFVITWASYTNEDGSSAAIRAQVFDEKAEKSGAVINVNSVVEGPQVQPVIATLANGNFVIAWSDFSDDSDGNGSAIKAQVFSPSGDKIGTEFLVNSQILGVQAEPAIASLSSGGFVVSWESRDSTADGNGAAIKAQIFDSFASYVGQEFLVNSNFFGLQSEPAIIDVGNGNIVVAWRTEAGGQPNDLNIGAQIFDYFGSKIGDEFFVNSTQFGIQIRPTLSVIPNIGFFAAWEATESPSDPSGRSIQGQLFDQAGSKIGGEFLVNSTTNGDQISPFAFGIGPNKFAVSWNSSDSEKSAFQFFQSDFQGSTQSDASDALLEYFARVVAYGEGPPNPTGLAEASGWQIERTFRSQDGLFQAVALRKPGSLLPPVLAIRGTTQSLADWLENTDLNGVGVGEAEQAVRETGGIGDWLKTNPGAILTGHSQGGAQAQWFANWAADQDTSVPIGRLVTFNSPGINLSEDDLSNVIGRDHVKHYISAGDIVSQVGLRFIPGDVIYYDFDLGSSIKPILFDASHTAHWFHSELYTAVPIYEFRTIRTSSAGPDSEFLSSPNFTHLVQFANTDDDFFEASLQIVSFLTGFAPGAIALLNIGPADAQAIFANRAGAEAARKTDLPRLLKLANLASAMAATVEDLVPQPGESRWEFFGEYVSRTILLSLSVPNDLDEISDLVLGSFEALVRGAIDRGVTAFREIVALGSEILDLTKQAIDIGIDAGQSLIIQTAEFVSEVTRKFFLSDNVVVANGNFANSTPAIIVDTNDQDAMVSSFGPAIYLLGPGLEDVQFGNPDSVIFGLPQDLNGTQVSGFTSNSSIFVSTTAILQGVDERRTPGSAILELDTDRNGSFETVIKLNGEYDLSKFTFEITASGTYIRYDVLPLVPVITSNGGGDSASVSLTEGQLVVAQVNAAATRTGNITYSIFGGADANRFTINAQTGQLSFAAAPDFEGPTDTGGDNVYQVIVRASDGSLSDTQTLSVTVDDRSVAPRLIAASGFAGGIGGTTAVFLTSGFQDISIIDAPGTITLSGAPGGDDILRFDGNAIAYAITRVGSRVEIADGDTRVSIPVSPTGINVLFADGPRTLGIVGGQVRLGSQLANNTPAAITAPAETDPLPNLADPAVRGRLIVAEGSPVTVAGKIDVFGTSFDNELFVAAGGDIAIRGGFTGGLDTVGFDGPASDYTAVRSGSTVFIETNGTRVSIPISPTGTKLLFGSEERLLKVDTATGKILIGTQEIGASPTPLTSNLKSSSIDASDVTVSISPNGGDLMALSPFSFGEMLAFASAGSSAGPQSPIDLAESGGLLDTQADLQLLLSDVSEFDPLGPADMLRMYYATAYTGMYAQAYLALDDDALMDIHQSGSQFSGVAPSPVMLASFDSFSPGG